MNRGRFEHNGLRANPWFVRSVPIISTLAGSSLGHFPVIVSWPMFPPFGLMMVLGWRLLRPELWPAWMALPLGLADDVLTGAPLGASSAMWGTVFIAIDLADRRMLWRDHWADWLIAALAISFCLSGSWILGNALHNGGSFSALWPNMMISIACFPAMQHICAWLDNWRLAR